MTRTARLQEMKPTGEARVAGGQCGEAGGQTRAPGQRWGWIVAKDDAMNTHYSLFFCEEEGIQSSSRVCRTRLSPRPVLFAIHGLDQPLLAYPGAGDKVNKANLT